MAESLAILALSESAQGWRVELEAHAKSAGYPLQCFEQTSDALSWLDDHAPRAIVLDTSVARATTLLVLARAKPSLVDVPILALISSLDDRAFARMLAVGADDVLPAPTVARIADRLRVLPSLRPPRPPPDRGRAVVADTDPTRCDVLGRVLGHAGYEVRLALDLSALEVYAAEPEVQLVVATTDLGDPEEVIPRVRQGASLPAWVVADPSLDPWANPRPVAGLQRVMAMSARSQPESVLFVSNSLLLAAGRTARGSRRLLYGTVVGFRANGAPEDDFGFTYNISASGLFVRTLAPPPPGEVSVELEPPGHAKRLRFTGEIVWTRPFGSHPAATTPPGFAVHLRDAPGDAMATWQKAYQRLAERAGVPVAAESEFPPPEAPEELAAAVTDGSGLHKPVGAAASLTTLPMWDLSPPTMQAVTPEAAAEPRLCPPRPSSSGKLPAVRAPAPTADAEKAVPRVVPEAGPTAAVAPPRVEFPTAKAPPPPTVGLAAQTMPHTSPVLQIPPTQPSPVAPAQPAVPSSPLPSSPALAAQSPAPEVPPLHEAPATPLPAPEAAPEAAAPTLPAATPAALPTAPAASAPRSALDVPSPAPPLEAALPVLQGPPSAPRPASGGAGLQVAAAMTALLAAGVAAWVFFWPAPRGESPKTPSNQTIDSPTALPSPAIATGTESTPTEPASAAPSTFAPAASVPAAASTPPPAETETPPQRDPVADGDKPAAGPCPESAPGDGADLLTFQGYLTVCSNSDLDVFATGLHLGRTNQKLLARCGLKFVRLGAGTPPAWKTEGRTVSIACRGATRIQIDTAP